MGGRVAELCARRSLHPPASNTLSAGSRCVRLARRGFCLFAARRYYITFADQTVYSLTEHIPFKPCAVFGVGVRPTSSSVGFLFLVKARPGLFESLEGPCKWRRWINVV